MHIGLAFDLQTDPADERQAEFDPPKTLDALEAALQSFGHRVTRLGNAEAIWRHPGHLSGIELVFNIAEGTHGRCREAWMPTLLDLFKVSYVGSDALALSVGLDKVLCKQLAMEAGLATPGWVAIHDPQNPPHPLRLQFPLIVKPRFEGSGRGIDAGAVVENKKALSDRLRWLHDHCPGAALVEEFIPEGELTVFLIGNAPSPRRFASRSEANRRCGGFANSGTKTGTDYTMPELAPLAYPVIQRPLDEKTRLAWHIIERTPGSNGSCVSPLLLEPVLEAQAVHAATTMFELLGCQDMARVDFRVDRSGKPWFLEINPLPSFDPEGTVGLLAEHMNLTYSQLIGRILDAALSRIQSRGVPHGNTQ